jgi:hypothetical protein
MVAAKRLRSFDPQMRAGRQEGREKISLKSMASLNPAGDGHEMTV